MICPKCGKNTVLKTCPDCGTATIADEAKNIKTYTEGSWFVFGVKIALGIILIALSIFFTSSLGISWTTFLFIFVGIALFIWAYASRPVKKIIIQQETVARKTTPSSVSYSPNPNHGQVKDQSDSTSLNTGTVNHGITITIRGPGGTSTKTIDVPSRSREMVFMHRENISRNNYKELEKVNRWVVVDTETTGLDRSNDRIVEIGIAVLENGEITEHLGSLINPEQHISAKASEVNGIYDEDVKDAPTYDEIADTILQYIDGAYIIAQNASFDLDFLDRMFMYRGHKINLQYVDTVQLSRYAFPELPDHKLETLVAALGISVERNHRAEDDAIATARVFSACLAEMRRKDEEEKRIKKEKREQEKREREEKYGSSPIYNLNFVFTGVFQSDRKSLEEKAVSLGGNLRQEVNGKTAYLVSGDISPLPDWAVSRKTGKAKELIEKGKDIKIISENEYIQMMQKIEDAFLIK